MAFAAAFARVLPVNFVRGAMRENKNCCFSLNICNLEIPCRFCIGLCNGLAVAIARVPRGSLINIALETKQKPVVYTLSSLLLNFSSTHNLSCRNIKAVRFSLITCRSNLTERCCIDLGSGLCSDLCTGASWELNQSCPGEITKNWLCLPNHLQFKTFLVSFCIDLVVAFAATFDESFLIT